MLVLYGLPYGKEGSLLNIEFLIMVACMLCIAQLLVLGKIKTITVQWLLCSMKKIASYYNFNSINVK
jgi:hypothetical protein